MSKKKKPLPKKSFLKTYKKIIAITFIVALLILVFAAYQAFKIKESLSQKAPTPVMKTLPKEIAKNLKNATPSANFRVPILMYHYVEYVKDPKDTLRQSLDINPNVFDAEIKTLKDAGFTFMTMSELGDVLNGAMTLPPKPIVLTFDDGYRDFATDALPILKKYNAKSTAYIVPGFINGPNSMFESQVVEATQSGIVEIGAHTVDHIYLKGRNYLEAYKEINDSKTMLEKYNVPIVSFAYPYGAFDQQSLDIVKKAGFKTAVSTIPGIEVNQNNRFFIYRIRPGGRTGPALLSLLEQPKFKEY